MCFLSRYLKLTLFRDCPFQRYHLPRDIRVTFFWYSVDGIPLFRFTGRSNFRCDKSGPFSRNISGLIFRRFVVHPLYRKYRTLHHPSSQPIETKQTSLSSIQSWNFNFRISFPQSFPKKTRFLELLHFFTFSYPTPSLHFIARFWRESTKQNAAMAKRLRIKIDLLMFANEKICESKSNET